VQQLATLAAINRIFGINSVDSTLLHSTLGFLFTSTSQHMNHTKLSRCLSGYCLYTHGAAPLVGRSRQRTNRSRTASAWNLAPLHAAVELRSNRRSRPNGTSFRVSIQSPRNVNNSLPTHHRTKS